MTPKYLNTAQAAALYGVSVSFLRKLRTEGGPGGTKGPPYKRLSRTLVVYRPEDLDAWFNDHEDFHSTAEEPAENLMPGRPPVQGGTPGGK